ncbi:hypothetical protein H2200_006528 [Cladophialophora chaetospira]|uniref:Uncharacterized protein n=1 Tax=Cladophialophora chaetospira TaxID=386627 RepID=A0AA39CHB0_9EURO|nr:hypothetical protein H2200_006528 [Cladophialophora chaetospira]
MDSTSSLRSASEALIQVIQYNPAKTAPEDAHAIRSNAVRYQWERSKEVRPRGRKSKVPKSLALAPEQASRIPEDDCADDDVPYPHLGPGYRKEANRCKDLDALPPPARSSLLEPGNYPSELPSGSIAPLLRLVHMVTSGTFVGDQAPKMSVIASRYVQQLRSHPASFHAAIWVCAKGMVDKSSSNPSVVKHRRFLDTCHSIAVKSVIEMISELDGSDYANPTEELGMLCSAMQSLALGTTEDVHLDALRPGPRQSTLKKLQNLYLWGAAPRWLNYHEEAARKILHANNCMDPFWAGLRVCQTQNDIISSCRTLTKPRSPCWFLNVDFADFYNKVTLQMEPRLTPGFTTYATTLSMTLSEPLLSVISDLILYASIQEALLSNRLTWFGLEYVCDARNWTQHQTMSLPSREETVMLAKQPQQAIMFNAVRHALIVYSLIAVFPLPLPSAPFPVLADRLDSDISQLLQDGQGATSATLLLWLSSMAALAAIGTPKRVPLVTLTAHFCQHLHISDWESMQATLQDFLWAGEISDFDGMYLFLEVQKQMFELDNGITTPEYEISRAVV